MNQNEIQSLAEKTSHLAHLEGVTPAERLYTERTSLYHFIFMTLLRCDRKIEDFLRKGQYVRSGMRSLDAGCGSGLVTKILHHMAEEQHLKDMTFHGFDLTPAMLERFQVWIAQSNLQREIQVCKANVLDLRLPVDWKEYDLIVCASMLEYIPRDQLVNALQNLAKLLSDDGLMLLFITKKNFVTQWLVGNWWDARLFTEGEMEDLLAQAGFHTIVRKLFSSPYRYVNHSTIALEARLSSQ